MRYRDREDAGRALAMLLGRYAAQPSAIVLGLARGGVGVAAPIAAILGLPLDVLVIRKLGLPWSREVAFGAVGPDGIEIQDDHLAGRMTPAVVAGVVEQARTEVAQQELRYRRDRPPVDIAGRVAILVDDGLATGATAKAGVALVRRRGAIRVILAVPVGAPEAATELARVADEVICPITPTNFVAVSHWYRTFAQLDDADVEALLSRWPG